MFCIDFEDKDLVSNTFGEYRPWVFNDGVTVVTSPQCPQGKRCGFFNASVLEVGFFANNYGHWPNLRITLEYKMIHLSGNIDQGIVSNHCFPHGNVMYAAASSLFMSASALNFNGGLKDSPGSGTTVTVVSNIVTNHSTYPQVATQSIHPAVNCTVIYKQRPVSQTMSVCGKSRNDVLHYHTCGTTSVVKYCCRLFSWKSLCIYCRLPIP